MKTLINLKKLFIVGIAAPTMFAVIACSVSDSPADTTTVKDLTSTEQVEVSDSSLPSSDRPFNDTDDTVVSNVIDESLDPMIDASNSEPGKADAEAVNAPFDGESNDSPVGDAASEADVQTPEPEVIELTAAEIVAAQQEHLTKLYEETVQSVVFILAGTVRGVGSGSGFVWDEEGHIVTNYHVIQGANNLVVKFFNGREYRADIIAFDPAADLAVIKLVDVEHDLAPIAIGNSSELRAGQTAIALGNPFGEEFTMTTGIVSAVTRTLDSGFSSYSIPSVVQTDAAINPGNSGGPLLDMNGAVIGVNTQIKSDSNQSSGVGFAVPVDLVKRVVPSLIEFGVHTYSLMGISGNEVNLSLRENVRLPGNIVGAYVSQVEQGGPADLAGIRGDTGTQFTGLNFDGDVIVSINSIPMKSMDDLIGYLALNTAPNDEIVVGIFRDGVETAIPMILGSRPTVS